MSDEATPFAALANAFCKTADHLRNRPED